MNTLLPEELRQHMQPTSPTSNTACDTVVHGKEDYMVNTSITWAIGLHLPAGRLVSWHCRKNGYHANQCQHLSWWGNRSCIAQHLLARWNCLQTHHELLYYVWQEPIAVEQVWQPEEDGAEHSAWSIWHGRHTTASKVLLQDCCKDAARLRDSHFPRMTNPQRSLKARAIRQKSPARTPRMSLLFCFNLMC